MAALGDNLRLSRPTSAKNKPLRQSLSLTTLPVREVPWRLWPHSKQGLGQSLMRLKASTLRPRAKYWTQKGPCFIDVMLVKIS